MERGPTKAGVLTVVVAVATALSQAATAAGGAPADVPVRTTIADSDTSGGPLRVRSDGNIPDVYETTTVGGKTTVTSMIYSFTGTSGQDFFLTTYYPYKNGFAASSRTVGIDLAGKVSDGAFPSPDLGTGQAPVQLGVKCRLATPNAVSLVGMRLDQSVECPGSLRFWAPDRLWYRFSFQPENFSNSDRWKVTCGAVGSSGCTKWRITPSGADGTSVNTLLNIDSQGTILAVGGDYRLTFSILVER